MASFSQKVHSYWHGCTSRSCIMFSLEWDSHDIPEGSCGELYLESCTHGHVWLTSGCEVIFNSHNQLLAALMIQQGLAAQTYDEALISMCEIVLEVVLQIWTPYRLPFIVSWSRQSVIKAIRVSTRSISLMSGTDGEPVSIGWLNLWNPWQLVDPSLVCVTAVTRVSLFGVEEVASNLIGLNGICTCNGGNLFLLLQVFNKI